ncbi:unnamed protein product [Clonostachys byssicola]|uniref:Uncharacterized protein n=1 Tax=Clonostachys byssicola TaxID=160290 RepID=A0A9N9U2S9_9HYPO|nr:unnamed protein product [Clonostachys byssicola]
MSSTTEPPRRVSYSVCHEVSKMCPVEATVLGYYPNFGVSIFFAVAFGLAMIAAGGLGVSKKTWTYGFATTAGLLLEAAGHIGRALLHKNPWNKDAFQLQICAIIIAPTLICVAIYVTLKHIALALNPSLSRIKPRLYPLIFLPADLSCLVLQAIGGGLAASGNNKKLIDGGNNTILAGIVLQVVVLAAFGVMGVDYWVRVKRYMASPDADARSLATWNDRKFRSFAYAVAGAYVSIFIRCIYRIAEMAGGWGNHIMQDEPSFLVLDSALILVATYLLTIFHPGLFFPQMCSGYYKKHQEEVPVGESKDNAAEASESPSSQA